MRTIVAGLFVSLDGVVESPEKWTGPYFSDEVGQEIGSQMAQSDTLLMGRLTYETFAASFANQSGGMADQMNNIPKVVVSTTLETADWQNSTLIATTDEVANLKQQPGRNISVSGSAGLTRSLLRENLLDELRLLVFPIVVGSGKRLFEDINEPLSLELVDAQTFRTGVLSLSYRQAGN